MLRTILVCALLHLSLLAIGQNRYLDSLNTVYHKGKDTVRIRALILAGEKLYAIDPDSGIVISSTGLKLFEQLPEKLKKDPTVAEMKAYLYDNLAQAHKNKSELPLALENYQQALNIRKKNKNESALSKSYSSIGIIYKNQGLQSQALDMYYKALAIREKLKDTLGLGYIYNNLGTVFKEQKLHGKALGYYEKAIVNFKLKNNSTGVAAVLNNMAVISFNTDNYPEAINFYKEANGIYKKIDHQYGKALTYCGLGTSYAKLKEYSSATSYLDSSLAIFKGMNNDDGVAFALHCRAEMLLEQKKYVPAKKDGEEALVYANKAGYPETIKYVANDLRQIYLALGQYKDAYGMFELAVKMNDSLINDATRLKSTQKEFQYAFEKKSLADSIRHNEEIKLNKAKVFARDEQLKREATQRYMLYGGLAMLFVFGVFMYNRFKVTSRQKNIIDKQRKEVIHQKEIVEEKNKEILDSITYAKRLQDAILPPLKLVKEYLAESIIVYRPKDIVAGDFYFMEPNGDLVIFAAADCTGHGVPGAMVSVVCSNALTRAVKEFEIVQPGQLLDKVRELVVNTFEKSESEVKDGMDISLCVLNTKINELLWSGANNPLWLIRKNATSVEEFKPNKQPIGKSYDPQPFTTHSIQLNAGDTFYIFTDGYEDQFGGEKGKKFKASKMKELFLSIQEYSLDHQKEKINEAFDFWKGELEQVDDVCIIGIRI